jgi:hypothetical protein
MENRTQSNTDLVIVPNGDLVLRAGKQGVRLKFKVRAFDAHRKCLKQCLGSAGVRVRRLLGARSRKSP